MVFLKLSKIFKKLKYISFSELIFFEKNLASNSLKESEINFDFSVSILSI